MNTLEARIAALEDRQALLIATLHKRGALKADDLIELRLQKNVSRYDATQKDITKAPTAMHTHSTANQIASAATVSMASPAPSPGRGELDSKPPRPGPENAGGTDGA